MASAPKRSVDLTVLRAGVVRDSSTNTTVFSQHHHSAHDTAKKEARVESVVRGRVGRAVAGQASRARRSVRAPRRPRAPRSRARQLSLSYALAGRVLRLHRHRRASRLSYEQPRCAVGWTATQVAPRTRRRRASARRTGASSDEAHPTIHPTRRVATFARRTITADAVGRALLPRCRAPSYPPRASRPSAPPWPLRRPAGTSTPRRIGRTS